MIHTIKQVCRKFNGRRPEVLVVVHEKDPRAGLLAAAAAGRDAPSSGDERSRSGRGRRIRRMGSPPVSRAPPGMMERRREMNPRENPSSDEDVSYG
jgi:hypothetical protein